METIKFAAPVDNNNKEWKKKKNYGPAALFTVVLLGMAFLAGKSYGRYDPSQGLPYTSVTGGMSINTISSPEGKCPDLHTFCQGQPPCDTTEDCPRTPGMYQSYTCKEGSCYAGDFPSCVRIKGSIHEVVCN